MEQVGPSPPSSTARAFASLRAGALALLLLGLCGLGVAAPTPSQGASLAQAAWPSLQGGPEHPGAAIGGPAPPLRVLWRATDSGDGRLSTPAVAPGAAVATAPAAVVGLDPRTGGVLWTLPRTPGPLIPPAVDPAEGLVVYAEGRTRAEGALVAVDLRTRRRRWRVALGTVGAAGPTVAGGQVFVGTREGSLVALDLATGQERWRVQAGGAVDVAPAASDGLVVAVAEERETGGITVLAAATEGCGQPTCRPLWSFRPRRLGAGSTSPTVVGGTVYVGLGDFTVYALDLRDGRERWRAAVHGFFSPLSSPAVEGGGVYLQDRLGGVYGLDAGSGEQRWDFQFRAGATWGAPLVVGGHLYVGLDDGTLAAIRTADGHLVWQADLGPGPVGGLAPAGEDHLLAPTIAVQGGVVALGHDPAGALVDLLSPTRLRPARALANFAAAAAALGLGLFVLFRFVAGRIPRGVPPPEGPR
ncbi:MAG TPA: PQQ-binding-like beta-propeller repeat protein [Actinomycetota bacterium]|nr:PQQ-binding-like beta-propeller repeat protein [Actinomycetota bacterium]